MIIKICGLRTAEHAIVAADAGADMIGLVFAPSRRQVSVEQAVAIVAALRRIPPPHPKIVGLFVNTPPAAVNATADAVGLDLVQLSGDESLADAAGVSRPILKSIRMDGSEREAAWVGAGVRLLVDAHVAGAYGGTGARADWAAAAELSRRAPIMLAGGLDPASVAAAIAQVRPWGVDVSSGVEEDGDKSAAKIRAFIAAARGAARS
ncbi:phosphoribosylanthranilate isomerase [Oscillochloris sp. ZM17-4]|uniref:phosphoribosylanthranilate isomerase n=1 Tax=Oscillochloris sp. ZM17-4 TaxID=2866714 RepID=UPI001C73BEE3|nr:phosphoribosylanthranilate isomerase [Oscillochloris sp. ZM17-4]MBX0327281.1 phosphoribosylanthranilate isomerase [Oscillochloris sp. ZM17-4]